MTWLTKRMTAQLSVSLGWAFGLSYAEVWYVASVIAETIKIELNRPFTAIVIVRDERLLNLFDRKIAAEDTIILSAGSRNSAPKAYQLPATNASSSRPSFSLLAPPLAMLLCNSLILPLTAIPLPSSTFLPRQSL